MLCQIVRRRGAVRRVERGVEPVVEIDLEPGEYVVDFDLHEAGWVRKGRKTTDWAWSATIAHVVRGPEPGLEELIGQIAEALAGYTEISEQQLRVGGTELAHAIAAEVESRG